MLAVKVINVCSISNLANHLERKWPMVDHLTPNDKNHHISKTLPFSYSDNVDKTFSDI